MRLCVNYSAFGTICVHPIETHSYVFNTEYQREIICVSLCVYGGQGVSGVQDSSRTTAKMPPNPYLLLNDMYIYIYALKFTLDKS